MGGFGMGLGPSTKMTTLHHYYCPITKMLLKEQGVEFSGIIINGVSERYDDKIFTAERTGDLVESMHADGAIVETDGWGNHHIDFVNVIEQLEKRNIPVIGMSYIGEQGKLVCTSPYVHIILDFNKNESGYESCIVGDNNLTEYDAMKAVALLKYKMKCHNAADVLQKKCVREFLRETYGIGKAYTGSKTCISNGTLILKEGYWNAITALESDIKNIDVHIIKPQERHVYINTNLDFMPIASKVSGVIGTGKTRILAGITAMLTGVEDESGFQPCNIGSSQGFLDCQVKFNQAGTPKDDDIILHIDVLLKKGTGSTVHGIRAAHRAADRVLNEIRDAMNTLEDMPVKEERFFDIFKINCPKVVLVKIVSGLGNMYETAVFPFQPGGIIGAKNIMDIQNMPILLTPNQCLDGGIHSLL
jgi:D-proline reductase (dithiol)-stabilizing protein PrdD